jgi:hypothetical protein
MVQQQISQHIDRLLMNCRVAVKYNIILIYKYLFAYFHLVNVGDTIFNFFLKEINFKEYFTWIWWRNVILVHFDVARKCKYFY